MILLYIGIFEIVLGMFQIARYFFHAIASLCIIIASNINSTLLQNTISEQSLSPRLGILYNKWKAYSQFKWIFGFFILKPSFLFFWKVFTLEPHGMDDWIHTFLDCILDYSILLAIIITFRPFQSPKLFNHLHPKSDQQTRDNTHPSLSIWPSVT